MTGYTREYVKVAVPPEWGGRNCFVTGRAQGMLGREVLYMG